MSNSDVQLCGGKVVACGACKPGPKFRCFVPVVCKRSMALRESDKANFKTLLQAAGNGNLCLLSTTRKSDSKKVALACVMNCDGEEYCPAPLAVLIESNPYEDFEDPTMS